jgi:tetratricopeptide (TPR) repeat protein
MKSNCLIWILLLCSGKVFCQSPASVKEYLQAFPTYGFSDPSPIPLIGPVYPYFRFDGFTTRPVTHEWKIVELQNDYIRVLIMPEIGGKIWTAIEKSANRPFIYYNHVVKFRDIAMRGPWSSGGLEPNYGIIGHTPNCATPVDYMTRLNQDGSVSCIIGVLDLLTRTNWSVEINLQKDKAFFTTQSFWYNSTGLEQPYYHWMNTGLKAKGDLEFIYPGTKYIGHAGEYADWPVNKNGKNLSFYEQNNFGGYKSYHVFGKYTDFFGAYWHDDDFGMARYAPHDEKAGKKIWIWGLSQQGMIWEKLLTDNDGQYVEVQSGRLFNQNEEKSTFTPFKHRSFAPFQSDTWKEYWYPVLRTKGMVAANEYGALNLKPENGWLKIYFSPAQQIGDTLKIVQSGKVLYSRLLTLSPLEPFADSIHVAGPQENFAVTLGDKKLLYQSDPTVNVLHRPVDPPVDFDWTTAYGLYLQAKEWMDQKMYAKAEDKLNECLQKDHNYFPALVRMSELLYRNLRYPEALAMARRALSIDTEAGDANYFYGLINAAMGNTVDARDGFDIATLSVDYRCAAYTALATIYLKEQDYDRTIRYAEKATDYDRYDIPALCLQAVAYRYQHKDAEARGLYEKIRSADPLNHFIYFEEYLLQPTEERMKAFTSGIRNELPAETYAELAIWYYSLGCTHESETLFSLSPPSAEAACWLAFFHHSKPDLKGINLNSAFFFRAETAVMLQQLPDIQTNWFLKYQLALILIDRNRIEEAGKLLLSCSNDPTFPPFYVVRSGIPSSPATPRSSSISAPPDTPAAPGPLADLQRALALDPGEWRYHKLLSEYYIAQEQYEKALAVVEPFYHAHPDQYIMGMLYAKALMLNNRYAAADAVLSALVIIPFEGATSGRELYREAKLTQAISQLQDRHYKKALAFVEMSRQWPDHLGVGKPYDEEIDVRMEDWIDYLIYKQMGAHDRADTALQAILRFSPRVDNTIKNFIPANTLVTAWAYQAVQKQDQAGQWLNQQIEAYPGNPVIIWSKAVFEKSEWIAFPEKIKEANIRLIEKLMATAAPH